MQAKGNILIDYRKTDAIAYQLEIDRLEARIAVQDQLLDGIRDAILGPPSKSLIEVATALTAENAALLDALQSLLPFASRFANSPMLSGAQATAVKRAKKLLRKKT